VREAIAEERVIFESEDGTRRPGVIRIEQPYVDDEGEARCPVVIEGLHERVPPVSGASSLQALLLGVAFCASLLRDFVNRGGRIYRAADRDDDENAEKDEEEFDIDQCFGPLAASPKSQRRQQAGNLRRPA